MKAHDAAVKLIREWAKEERDITEADIRTLNKIILVEPYWKVAETPDGQKTERLIEIGKYKDSPNSVRLLSGEMHFFASPEETPAKMQELMDRYYNRSKGLHPFQVAATFHHQFVSIHPFDDGNGRVARLVMNFILLKGGFPPVIIKASDKQNYYAALQKADARDLASFMQYITEQLIWSLELSIKAAKGESVEEPDDVDKELALFEKNLERFSSDIVETKSEKTLDEVLNQFIDPFLRILFNKLEKVQAWFASTTHYFHLNGTGSGVKDINELVTNIRDSWGPVTPGINSLDINLSFNKLKRLGVQAFDIHKGLKISFEDHKYSVTFNIYTSEGREPKEFLYDKAPTEKEMNEMATRFVRDIMTEIDNRIKALPQNNG